MDLASIAKEYQGTIRKANLTVHHSSHEITEAILGAVKNTLGNHGALIRSLFHSQLRATYPFLYYNKGLGLPIPDGASRRAFMPTTLKNNGIATTTLLSAIQMAYSIPPQYVKIPTLEYRDPLSGMHRIQATSPIDYRSTKKLVAHLKEILSL